MQAPPLQPSPMVRGASVPLPPKSLTTIQTRECAVVEDLMRCFIGMSMKATHDFQAMFLDPAWRKVTTDFQFWDIVEQKLKGKIFTTKAWDEASLLQASAQLLEATSFPPYRQRLYFDFTDPLPCLTHSFCYPVALLLLRHPEWDIHVFFNVLFTTFIPMMEQFLMPDAPGASEGDDGIVGLPDPIKTQRYQHDAMTHATTMTARSTMSSVTLRSQNRAHARIQCFFLESIAAWIEHFKRRAGLDEENMTIEKAPQDDTWSV